jgi:hypothetical protein
MVTVRWLTFLLAASPLVSAPLPLAPSWTDYRAGDVAAEDIVTPVPLIVVDEEATQALRRRAAERLAVQLRYYTNAAAETEAAFRAAFARTRANFLSQVETAFGRASLDGQQLASARFQRLVHRFQFRNLLFPADTNLASLWAAGESGEAVENAIAARLRPLLERPILSPAAPPPGLIPGPLAHLIPLADTNEMASAQLADRSGPNVAMARLAALPAVQTEVREAFPPPDSVLADYLVTFVRPNCVLDADLTRQFQAEHTVQLVVADHYDAGQVIAWRGRVISRKMQAALRQLQDKSEANQLLRQRLVDARLRASRTDRLNRLLMVGSLAVLSLSVVVLRLALRRQSAALLQPLQLAGAALSLQPAVAAPGSLMEPPREPGAPQLLRVAGLSSGGKLEARLAAALSTPFVQRLMACCARLTHVQQQSAAEVERLGEGLMTVHSRMQKRLFAYERRIAELEKELETREDENRELIRTELERLRWELELERARVGSD